MAEYNFGIIGLGRIAHTFAEALHYLKLNLHGVASRDMKKALEFKRKYNAKNAYDSYEEMLKNPDINIVYIATPHGFHYEHLLLCLNYNKNIICEKSFTLNEKQASHIFKLAQEKNLLVMEAMWSRFLPMWKKINTITESKIYGNVIKIEACFAFQSNLEPSGWLLSNKLGGGALLDIGVYLLNLAYFILKTPQTIQATANLSDTGVDLTTNIILQYENAIADLICSIENNKSRNAIIYLEKATIKLFDFWACQKAIIYDPQGNLIEELDDSFQKNGFEYQILSFIEALDYKKTDNSIMPSSVSLEILRQMDAIRSQIGVIYCNE